MGNVNLPPIDSKGHRSSDEYLRYIAESLAMLQEELQNILEGRISAQNIRSESIETRNLKAGSVVADKIDVTELSAISANMGTITAGSITTNAAINVGTDATIGNNLNMGESDYTGSKAITWSTEAGISAELEVQSGDVGLRADGFVTMTIGSSQGLVVNKKITASALHATNGVTGTWYAATSSGGSPTVALSFVDGILVSAV
jgi:hypothetical protein